MSPAEVASIVIDETNTMDVAVQEKICSGDWAKCSFARRIDRWELNVMTVDEAGARQEQEVGRLLSRRFVDEELAGIMVEEGFVHH